MKTIIITLASAGESHIAMDLAFLISTIRAAKTEVYFLRSTKESINIHLN